MKVVQFGLKFSPNLGDGVIAECISYGVKARSPEAEVSHVDLSGRQGFGEVVISNRETILAVIDRLPLVLRQALVSWKLRRVLDRLAPQWRAAAQADLAVIGGGQIFADANLNFPIKVEGACKILAEAGTPTAVFGVGVAKGWSARGATLFSAIINTDLRMIGVRDAESMSAWSDQMASGPAPTLTLDPGLLAALAYGPCDAGPHIGVCVTDFGILAHHATGSVAGAAATPEAFYVDVIKEAVARDQSVCLFCNGAAEDVTLLEKVSASPSLAELKASGQVVVPAMPTTPTELVSIIAGCKAVIAHRLHACIVAYSYGRPIVGLGWDAKLESFFATAGVSDGFSKDPGLTATQIVDLVDGALKTGIDLAHHASLMDQTWDGFDRLLACAA